MSALSIVGLGVAIIGEAVRGSGQALLGNVTIGVGGALVILGVFLP